MKPIECHGFFDSEKYGYDVNLSSVFSHLIRECGKLVEYYNSDLFYDFKTIERYVESPIVEGDAEIRIFWTGLRESGVDGEDFIKCRYENDCYYRGLYKITVEKYMTKCSVVMEKSSLWDFRREHNIIK